MKSLGRLFDFTRRSLSQRPGLRGIAVNTGWLLMDRVVRLGLGVVVGVMIARYLGPGQFGLINFATAMVALFGFLTTLGLDNIIVKDLVEHPENAATALGTGLVLRAGGALLTIAATLSAMYVIGERDRLTLLLGTIYAGAMLFRMLDVVDFQFQARVLSKYTVWAGNAAFLVTASVKLALIWNQASLAAFAWADFAGAALTAVALLLVYRWTGGAPLAWRFDFAVARRLLAASWPLMISSFAIIIYMRIDQVMLKKMLGEEAVGLYSAATRLSEVWYFIPLAVVSSVFPAVVQTRKANIDLYHQRLARLFALMSLIALAIAVPMTFLSRPLVLMLFGEEFAGAGPVLSVHIWAALFVFWGVAQEPWNLSEGLQRLTLYRTLAGAVINVLLNLVLIPRYGPMGAAVATVVAYAATAWVANVFDRRTRPIFFLQMRSVWFPKYLMNP